MVETGEVEGEEAVADDDAWGTDCSTDVKLMVDDFQPY